MKPTTKPRGNSKGRANDSTKRIKKKASILLTERVEYVDYKDVNLLQRFVSDRSKIRARRVNGNDVQQQRDVTTAIKNARELALMPYAKRVTTTRGGKGGDRGDRGDRPRRGEAPAEERAPEAAVEAAESDVAVEVEEAGE
jgi:small subunit ribosomal protein S18